MRIGMLVSPMASLRATRQLASAFHRYVPAEVTLVELPLAQVPIQPPYDDAPLPQAGTAWKAQFGQFDALVVLVRARTRSVPGHLKIGIDWASQPEPANALRDMPCVVVAVGEGRRPSFLALQHARTVLSDAGANVMRRPDFALVIHPESFGPEGVVTDPELAEGITDVLHSAAGFSAHHRRAESLELPELPPAPPALVPNAQRTHGPVL